jgi:hypothetical protein
MKKQRNPYPFIPKDAPSIWFRVIDVTNCNKIRPFRGPNGRFIELEEFRSHVPRCLRGMKKGFPPDEVADMLGLEDSQALYKALDWNGRAPERDIPEIEQEYRDSRIRKEREEAMRRRIRETIEALTR